MTEPIELLDEASWLHHYPADGALLEYWVARPRTVGDLRRLLALARTAERLRVLITDAADQLEAIVTSRYADEPTRVAAVNLWRHDLALVARAALEGADR